MKNEILGGKNSIYRREEIRKMQNNALVKAYKKAKTINIKALKLSLFCLLLIFSLTLQAQKFDFKVKSQITHTVDLAVLTATTVYWLKADNVQPDKVIHFLFGYFSTQAMYYLLEPLDLPKGLKAFTPILVFGGLATFKELIDTKADWKDWNAGMAGCGVAVISFNLVYRF